MPHARRNEIPSTFDSSGTVAIRSIPVLSRSARIRRENQPSRLDVIGEAAILLTFPAPSSRGPGHWIFSPSTGVRIPLGSLSGETRHHLAAGFFPRFKEVCGMDVAAQWRELFANWPQFLPREGLLITGFGESIPFINFMVSAGIILLERDRPDSQNGRKILVSFLSISALKLSDPGDFAKYQGLGFAYGAKKPPAAPVPKT